MDFDGDEEDKDTIGETRFTKPIKSIRSSSILHSVEDLSTDSTCVYKARNGFDSNRGSRRRTGQNPQVFSTEELLTKVPLDSQENRASIRPFGRGLSKSMTIPTPVSNFSEYWDNRNTKSKTCCERIKRWASVLNIQSNEVEQMFFV